MAYGISTYLANKLLGSVGNAAAYTPPTHVYAKQHVGDPGAAGTANPSVVTTRSEVDFNTAAAGSLSISNVPAFACTGTETITGCSFWDAATSGNFLWSAVATSSKNVGNGDTININTAPLSIGPLAA